MTLKLERHLQRRIENHQWLISCVDGNYHKFPYHLSSTASGKVDSKYNHVPCDLSKGWPDCTNSTETNYLLNIPTVGKCRSVLKLLKDELFGATSDESKVIVKQRVAVVIGLNRAHSLDNQKNETFLNTIGDLEKVKGIAYRVFGFFWSPTWKTQHQSELLYTASKCYLLFKVLAPDKAPLLLAAVENSGLIRAQVPYQQIRERIKNSADSKAFAGYFEQKAPHSFTYFGIMDDDTRALRDKKGVLSLLDEAIAFKQAPSVISCGYRVDDVARPLLKRAVQLDMAVRAAMNSVIAYSAYFPEPGSFFCIRRPPGSHFLSQLSFVGDGVALESRRLIQNGRRAKLFDDRALFLSEGGPLTTVPERMETLKNGKLMLAQYKQKGFLQALRAASQTHATPKQWADNLYVALSFSTPHVTDATTPMMQLFSLYDPISRMFAKTGRYTKKTFDDVVANYHAPLLAAHQNIRQIAYANLLGLGMDIAMINQVEAAAIASGKAIVDVISL